MKRDLRGRFIKTFGWREKVKLVFFSSLIVWAFIGAYGQPYTETVYQRPTIEKEVQDLIDSRTAYAQGLPVNAKLSKEQVEKKVIKSINILTTFNY